MRASRGGCVYTRRRGGVGSGLLLPATLAVHPGPPGARRAPSPARPRTRPCQPWRGVPGARHPPRCNGRDPAVGQIAAWRAWHSADPAVSGQEPRSSRADPTHRRVAGRKGASVAGGHPLPHQITAVHEDMRQREPLRFLRAAEPGAGQDPSWWSSRRTSYPRPSGHGPRQDGSPDALWRRSTDGSNYSRTVSYVAS